MKCKYYIEPVVIGALTSYPEDREHVIVAINEHEPLKGKVEVYNVTCGHAEADIDYIKSCKEITAEKYKDITKGWYTPSEYLEGANNNE